MGVAAADHDRVPVLLPTPAIRPRKRSRIRGAQRICMPEIARAMTSRWISEVPSKIV